MPTNRALRAELLRKMDWKKQTLSARVQKKKEQTPMSTEDATYLIAHENNIKIDRYLTDEQIARVRSLQMGNTGNTHNQPQPRASIPRKGGGPKEIRFPNEFKATNPLLSVAKLNEAREMAALYPLLYVLENSIRELIKRVMQAKFGTDWWDIQLNAGKLKGVHQTAANHMRTETEKNSWHQRRGAHPIDYVYLDDLGAIIQAKQEEFIPNIIPDRDWFVQFMKTLEPSRNVVCHMNPLDRDNISDVKLHCRRWEKVLKNAADKIPAAR
jgi:hypothetical protein